MPITAKLDELGKPAWIALVVLGFMVWWPIGLSALPSQYGADVWDADITAAMTAGSTKWNACRARWTGCDRG